MSKVFEWPYDSWAEIETENGDLVDLNFYIDDSNGGLMLTIYPVITMPDGTRETDTTGESKRFQVTEVEDE